ncbi:DUF4234 domain-containing protein [Endozoicomonas euniceicola]|uniref:DUF4234 domain-containing protein n=1 Tax=Endozoicomonas euniceicola TaxID=1234143 RepID=A0ABY6GUF9_9GAMM|nr:DUF4234 domain-containing protein [Endozoicomonas euniceicola]UYM16335.1 DUF4234 domain-containing protein [Endozoicomonas euniceicola]
MNEPIAENSPYRTPYSDLNIETSSNKILYFKRFSAWGVFGLSLITFGIYPLYWLYSRTKVLNSIVDNRISDILLNTLIVLFIMSFVIGVSFEEIPENTIIAALDHINYLSYMVIYLTVLFKFRNRLRDMIGTNIGSTLTFFGSAIYLQYKINKEIDNQ